MLMTGRVLKEGGTVEIGANFKESFSAPLHCFERIYSISPLSTGNMSQDPQWMKPQIVPNPIYTVFFPTHTYL